MSAIDQSKVHNTLLSTVNARIFARFSDGLERVDLPCKYVLVEDGLPPDNIYFLESGLASMIATSPDDQAIEIGHIGREGASGMHVMLAVPTTPGRTFMQVAGTGLRLPTSVFLDSVASDDETRDFFLRYLHTTVIQLAHSALANGQYKMEERLARWILMCHDRLDGDHLAVTHEFLSTMLGVRRSGVTEQLHILEGHRAIRSTRGDIHVLSREKLLEIAGGCYGVPEREYEKVLGLPLRVR